MKQLKQNKLIQLETAFQKAFEFEALKYHCYNAENATLLNMKKGTPDEIIEEQLDIIITARRHFRWAKEFTISAENNLNAYKKRHKL